MSHQAFKAFLDIVGKIVDYTDKTVKVAEKVKKTEENIEKSVDNKQKQKKSWFGKFVNSKPMRFILSPSFGTALLVASSLLMMASPVGLVAGGILAGAALVGVGVTIGSKISRMRNLDKLKEEDKLLTKIDGLDKEKTQLMEKSPQLKKLMEKVGVKKEGLGEKGAAHEASTKEAILKGGRGAFVGSAVALVAGIASLNPVIIGVTVAGVVADGAGSMSAEKKYRKGKAELLNSMVDKKHKLGVNFELGKGRKALYEAEYERRAEVAVMNDLQGEIDKAEKAGKPINYADLEKMYGEKLAAYKKENTLNIPKPPSVMSNIGTYFKHSFDSKASEKLMDPLAHREEAKANAPVQVPQAQVQQQQPDQQQAQVHQKVPRVAAAGSGSDVVQQAPQKEPEQSVGHEVKGVPKVEAQVQVPQAQQHMQPAAQDFQAMHNALGASNGDTMVQGGKKPSKQVDARLQEFNKNHKRGRGDSGSEIPNAKRVNRGEGNAR